MSEKDEDLLALKLRWYEKLKKSGFQDIENQTHKLKIFHARYFSTTYDDTTFESKRDYYREACFFLWDFTFDNDFEREVWRQHSEGVPLRTIAQNLRTKKNTINKDNINEIIVRLRDNMKGFYPDDRKEDSD